MRILLVLWVMAASLLAGIDPAGAQNSPLGVNVQGTVSLGGRTLPLPAGEWMVVAKSSSRSTAGHIEIDRMYLAQMSGDKLARWIVFSTNAALNPGGWTRDKDICDRTNVHAGHSDNFHNPRNTECWSLNHYGQTLGTTPSQAGVDFYRWSDGRGRPNTSVALTYFFAKNGDFLRAEYHFNPVLAGFPDTPTAVWRGNPWHVDVASKDAKKLAYLRDLKVTGEALFQQLKTVLK